jgi:colicin import membrane protein
MFQSQVERCWKKPYGDPKVEKPEAAFEIKLRRDGTLDGIPVMEGTPASAYQRLYQQSALRAITECQPYNLPAAFYDEWKYFAPVFTERVAGK